LAEWGLYPGEASEEELAGLVQSWVARKRFEASLIALEVGQLFTGRKAADEQISPDEMWALLDGLG
jgi:hypothetical protein